MTDYTLPLSHVRPPDHDLVGGKALGLGALIDHGFSVPSGFVVTTAAYRDFAAAAGLRGLPPTEMSTQFARTPIDDEIIAQVLAAYADLGRPAVAVRSSGTAEDLVDASFAGQHSTFLDTVGDDALIAALSDCWASLWNPSAIAYREQCGRDHDDVALAVVVQEMVDADWAGVMFTADPVTGDRRRVVIEAVRGLGESLVSGTATGERHVVAKRTRRPVGRGPHLPKQRSLVGLGIEAEAALGGPLDIEWAYNERGFQLLQARPLTALPEESLRTAHDGSTDRGPDWEMALDHMPLPPYPIDLDLFIRPALDTILGRLRSAGLTAATTDGVISEIDDGVVQLRPPRVRLELRSALGLLSAAPALVSRLRASTTTYRDWVATTLMPLVNRVDAEDLSAVGDDGLLDRIDSLLSTIGHRLPDRFGAIPRGRLADKAARWLLGQVVDDLTAERLHEDLTAAVRCVTTDSNAALGEIAQSVRENPVLRQIYATTTPAEVAGRLQTSPPGRDLDRRVDAFLSNYGFREMSIFSLGVASLRERPDVVHRMIAGLALDDSGLRPDDHHRPIAARQELRRAGPRARLLHRPILKLIDTARTTTAFREDSHYQLVMVLSVARRVLLERGRRLVEDGGLTDADDIAYLKRSELDLPPAAMKAVVDGRRTARHRSIDGYTFIPADMLGRRGRDDAVAGTPASRGTATGVVRVIGTEDDFGKLRTGEILVCPYTNPTWTPLFSIAAAVVVDTGGMGSHAAIVARERGIPAVMGTGNGTLALHDGERVVVNADEGVVHLITGRGPESATAGTARAMDA